MTEPLVVRPEIAFFKSRDGALAAARRVPAHRISLRYAPRAGWSVLVDGRAWLRTDGSVS